MTHTRYSSRNLALLVAGAVLCAINAVFVSLTAGFATDPVRDFGTFSAAFVLYASLLSVPLYLILWRWSGLAATGMWIVTGCSFLLILIGASHLIVLVFPLFLLSLLAQCVHSGSRIS
jgi:uncharacterized membrane-anchored protein YitT (DUF2179 family)